MKKLIALCFLFAFIVSCSSNDDTVAEEEQNTETPVQEPINTILRPSKISKGNLYWLFEYDEDRVTKVENYSIFNILPGETFYFNYDSNDELTSIERGFGTNIDALDFVFENGKVASLTEEFAFISAPHISTYFHDSQNRLIKKEFVGYGSDYYLVWPREYTDNYIYENDNIVRYERTVEVNASQRSYLFEYDDQNHPFKHIDPRCSVFLKLPNTISNNGGYSDDKIFSYLDRFKVQSFNNNLIKAEVDGLSWENTFTLIYNEQGYPIEIQPGNGSIPGRIYIEY